MKVVKVLSLLVVLAASIPAQNAPADLCGRFENKDGLRVLTLWGTADQRGFAQGWLLAKEIVFNFDQDLQKLMGRGSRLPQYEKRLLKFVVPRFSFTAEEEAELKGMLRGIEARLPEKERVFEALGRVPKLLDLKAANTVGDWMALGCSTFAVAGKYTKDGKPAAARNFDFAAFRMVLDDQHVVVVKPSEKGRLAYVGVSYPGSIGVTTGLNEEGVFISIHDVFVPATPITAVRRNVPRLCALRRVMTEVGAKGALDRAFEMSRSWPTLYGNNFMVVTPDARADGVFAAVLEYDNRRHIDEGANLRTSDHPGQDPEPFLLCTNHHRARKPRRSDPARLCKRYNSLRDAVAKSPSDPLSVDAMFEVLSVAAFPRGMKPQERYRHGTTHQAVAFTGTGELWVRLGEVGKNIRQITPRCVVLKDALAKAGPAQAVPVGPGNR